MPARGSSRAACSVAPLTPLSLAKYLQTMPSERRALGYQPALDGLRALAITLVVCFHFFGLPGGYLGVDLFFVLSGFLITTLLLEERARYEAISFGRFYLRRALRLFPALWVFLAASLVIYAALGSGVRGQ